MRRIGRVLGRKLGWPSVQGIRFRLGVAMAVALLPILLLAMIQTEAGFRRQAAEQRIDLQLAADRSAAHAKNNIDSAVVLLQALAPEGVGFYCEPRLTTLVERMDSIAALARFSATGEPVCASRSVPPPSGAEVRERSWYQRLRRGEDVVMEWTGPAL